MQLIHTAKALDYEGWMIGLISAGISGAATSVSSAIVLPALDATVFNVFTVKYYVAIGALGLASAIGNMAKFLSTKPLPDYKEVVQTTQTVTGTGDGGKVIETTKETRLEPIDKKIIP